MAKKQEVKKWRSNSEILLEDIKSLLENILKELKRKP